MEDSTSRFGVRATGFRHEWLRAEAVFNPITFSSFQCSAVTLLPDKLLGLRTALAGPTGSTAGSLYVHALKLEDAVLNPVRVRHNCALDRTVYFGTNRAAEREW